MCLKALAWSGLTACSLCLLRNAHCTLSCCPHEHFEDCNVLFCLCVSAGFLINPIVPDPLNPNASDLHNIPLSFAPPLHSRSLCPDGLEAAWSLVLLTLGARGLSEEDRISPNTLEVSGCCCHNFLIWWRVRRTGGTTGEGEEWRSKFETKRLALKIITNTDLVLLKPPGQEAVI